MMWDTHDAENCGELLRSFRFKQRAEGLGVWELGSMNLGGVLIQNVQFQDVFIIYTKFDQDSVERKI